jgi:hypothetical protein
MKQFFLYFILCCSILMVQAQSIIPPLKGWKVAVKNGSYEFTPNTLLNSEFSYTILPLAEGDEQALTKWLPVEAVRDLAVCGYVVPKDAQVKKGKIQSFITYSTIVEDKLARRMAVSYMAYRKDTGTIRYGKLMTLPTGANKNYLNAAVQHFINLSKQEGMISDKKLKIPNGQEIAPVKQKEQAPVAE